MRRVGLAARVVVVAAALGSFGIGITSTNVAYAQQPGDKDQDAERLFREGQKLMEDRRFGEACPKFEAAYKKDQQLGTLLNLAYCHKEQNAIWQAWLEFKEAEMKAIELKRTDRKEFARQKMAELEKEKTLTRVMIEPTTKVELVEVNVEDKRIPEAERGVPFAAEPGQRKITFRAKGKKDKSTYVTLVRGDKPQKIAVPEMETETASPPPPVDPTPPKVDDPPTKTTPPPAAADDKGGDGSTQRTLGIILVGVGVVGVGVGAVTGLMTLNNECAGGRKNDAPCKEHPERAKDGETTATMSNIGFVVGGAGIVGGAILYFLAPSGKASAKVGGATRRAHSGLSASPQIGVGWAGVKGSF